MAERARGGGAARRNHAPARCALTPPRPAGRRAGSGVSRAAASGALLPRRVPSACRMLLLGRGRAVNGGGTGRAEGHRGDAARCREHARRAATPAAWRGAGRRGHPPVRRARGDDARPRGPPPKRAARRSPATRGSSRRSTGCGRASCTRARSAAVGHARTGAPSPPPRSRAEQPGRPPAARRHALTPSRPARAPSIRLARPRRAARPRAAAAAAAVARLRRGAAPRRAGRRRAAPRREERAQGGIFQFHNSLPPC
jgi:hypothetical protein